MKELWNWLITSSADPEKTSATVKGFLKLFVGQIAQALSAACSVGIYCMAGNLDWLNNIIDLVGLIVFGVLTTWGAIQALYGIARKVHFGRWAAPTE